MGEGRRFSKWGRKALYPRIKKSPSGKGNESGTRKGKEGDDCVITGGTGGSGLLS